jgi:drug/metabolite transporter (DMT)-like permease
MYKQAMLPVLAMLIWAFNINVNKLAVGVVDPATISFYREFIAAVILLVFFGRGLWRERTQIISQMPRLFALGLLGTVLVQCLAYIAAETTSATNMSLILALVPLLTVLLGVGLIGEVATVGAVAGGVVSLLGLNYLLSGGDPISLLQHGITLGDGLMVVGALCYAAYNVLLKRWRMGLNTWHSLTMQIWSVIPLLFVYFLYRGAPPITQAGLPLVLYAAIGASLIAPFFWMRGVEVLGPGRTSALINLLPVMSVTMAAVFLGEQLYSYHLIGGGVTLLGIGIANAIKRPLHKAAVTKPAVLGEES